MLIFEGLDYAGKTTWLERIAAGIKRRRWSRRHSAKVHSIQRWGKLPPHFDYNGSYLAAIQLEQLCDRFALSELAYGTVLRGGPHERFTPHRRRLVARELNRAGSVQVLLRADWRSTQRRMTLRPDPVLQSAQRYLALSLAYEQALEDPALGKRGLPTFILNTSDDVSESEIRSALESILDFWKDLLVRAAEMKRLAPQSYGSLYPKVVFVGERVGGDRTGTRPFSGDGGSSQTLSDLLEMARVPEGKLYFVNAFDGRGIPLTPLSAFEKLKPRLVIALGKLASRYLTQLGVPHKEFPHPQYLRRFENPRLHKWAGELQQLLAPVMGTSDVT